MPPRFAILCTEFRGAMFAFVLGLALASAPPVAAATRGASDAPPFPVEERFERALGAALHGAGSPTAFPRILELRSLRERVPAARYAAAFERLGALRSADPRVAAAITRERARLLRGRGADAAGADLEAPLGVARRWFVAGPFPSDRGARLDAPHPIDDALCRLGPGGALPPVTDLSPDVGVDDPTLGFRPLAARADGLLNLESSLWPRSEVVAYAATYVHTERDADAALRFGAAEAVRVCVNGVQVHERLGATEPIFDADEVGVRLRAGWNLIVVKLYRGGAPWGVVLRVTAPDGAPLQGSRGLGPDEAPPSVAGGGAASYVAVAPGPYAWWSARADERPRDEWSPAFVADLARVLHGWGRTLPLDRQPAALLGALDDDTPAAALLSLAEVEPALHRRAGTLARALRRAPDDPAVLLAFASLERDRQRYVRALELLERLPPAAREGWEARSLRARVHLDNQLYGEARVALLALVEARPDTPTLLRAIANLEVERGARREAMARFEALAGIAGDDPEVLFWLAQLHRELQEPEEALAWHDRFTALRPDLPHALLEQARTLDAWGRADDALAIHEKAVASFPRHPDVLEAAAAFLHRRGETSRALELWRRSLALEPHNPDLRAYLSYLAPSEPSFEAPFRRDAAAVAAAWRGPDGTLPESQGEDVSVLLDQRVVRVWSSGATTRFHADVLAVHRPPRAEEDRRYRVLFDPLRQRVEILEAAIIDRGGARREQLGRRELRLSESWYGLYYELHAIELTFEDLAPGDVLAIAYRVVDLEPGPRAGTFGDVAFIQGPAGRREVEYVVVAPAEMTLYHRLVTPNGALEATRSETTEGGLRTIRYRVADVAPVPQEIDAPGQSERAAFVHVSSFRDYGSVGRWYGPLARGARTASAAVRAAAHAAADGLGPVKDRIAALHRAVVERIRYVGLEFGIHGIQPYDAPEVFDRRFGDCKDTATLLAVMLGESGIRGEVVLVRTRPLGAVPDWPASLAVFDHAIVYVPEVDLWIDPTVRDAPPGVLPPGDQDALALRLTGEGPRLATVPRSPAAADRAILVQTVRLRPDGGADVEADESWTGWRGAQLRGALRTPLTRDRVIQERVAARRPASAVRDLVVEGHEGLAAVLRLRYRATVPALGDPDRRGLRLPVGALLAPLSPRISAALASVQEGQARRLPLDVPNRFSDDVTVRVTLPAGWDVATAPADRTLTGPYGSLSRTLVPTADGYEVRIAYAVDAAVVPAADVSAFAAFCEAVDRALAEAVVVSPTGGVGGADGETWEGGGS